MLDDDDDGGGGGDVGDDVAVVLDDAPLHLRRARILFSGGMTSRNLNNHPIHDLQDSVAH